MGTQSRCSVRETTWRSRVVRELGESSGDRGQMCACGQFLLMYGENHKQQHACMYTYIYIYISFVGSEFFITNK